MRSANLHRLNRNYDLLDGEDFLKNYFIGKELGRSNARVFEAKHKKHLTKAALKEIRLSDDADADTSTVKKEINLLMKIQEKDLQNFFVKYLNFCIIKEEIDNFNSTTTAYILMEKGFCSMTKLIDSRKKNLYHFQYFYLEEIFRIFKHLIAAFAFLQKELNISHCDVKPENLLIMGENDLEFKVCDVGAGEILMTDQQTKTKTIKGTIPFLAPELLSESLLAKKSCNPFKADVFSLGLCFIYMITFKKFSRTDRQVLNEEVFQETLNEWIEESFYLLGNEDLILLLKAMLEINPKLRPDFKELQEKFINNNLMTPTISEEMNNWTLNNEELTNSYIATEEINTPGKKEKSFLIRKSPDRIKSLHAMPQNLINMNNFQILSKENKNNNSYDNVKTTLIIQKSLSPVKIMKQTHKKFSVEENEFSETSPSSPEQKRTRKTENLNNHSASHKNFTIQLKLKETKESEENKCLENPKKSIFGKKNSMKDVPKKTHQKIVSNMSELLYQNGMNGPIYSPKEPASLYGLNQITRNENFFFGKKIISNNTNNMNINDNSNISILNTNVNNSNKNITNFNSLINYSNLNENPLSPSFFKTNQPNFISNITNLNANTNISLMNFPSIISKKNEVHILKNENLINLKAKKNRETRKLPPLILPDNFTRIQNLSILNGTSCKNKLNEENKANNKVTFFLHSPKKKNLIINLDFLQKLVKKQPKCSFQNNVNIFLDQHIEETEILAIFNELLLVNKLSQLAIDLYFTETVSDAFIKFLSNSNAITSLIMNYKEKPKNESPLSFYKSPNISHHQQQATINNFELFSKNLNDSLLSHSHLLEFSINIEKLNDIHHSFVKIFSNFHLLKTLISLKISCKFISLTNQDLLELFKNLQTLESLEILELFCENNLITEDFFQDIPIFLSKIKKASISLANNKLNLSEIKQISLPFTDNLENLSLDFEGNLLGNGLQSIFSEISKQRFLKTLQLNLADCKLNSASFMDFSNDIYKIKYLESLVLNLKGNDDLAENCIVNLGKTIKTNFQNLRFLELNFLYIDIGLNVLKSYLSFANYLCYLKLEFFNLFLFRNVTQKTIKEVISSNNKELKFESCLIYPDLKEVKIFLKLEKKESFLNVFNINFYFLI